MPLLVIIVKRRVVGSVEPIGVPVIGDANIPCAIFHYVMRKSEIPLAIHRQVLSRHGSSGSRHSRVGRSWCCHAAGSQIVRASKISLAINRHSARPYSGIGSSRAAHSSRFHAVASQGICASDGTWSNATARDASRRSHRSGAADRVASAPHRRNMTSAPGRYRVGARRAPTPR